MASYGRLAVAGLLVNFFLVTDRRAQPGLDPKMGSTQTDINFEYKDALARATARERAEKIISDLVVKGADVTEEEAEKFTSVNREKYLVNLRTCGITPS